MPCLCFTETWKCEGVRWSFDLFVGLLARVYYLREHIAVLKSENLYERNASEIIAIVVEAL